MRDLALLRSTLTARDQAILGAVASYRYLNLRQLEQLFFPSERTAQIRLKHLKDQGLLLRWKVIEPPGITRRPSVFLLSGRGARVLAAARGEDDPRRLIREAVLAGRHCLNVVHDLEANSFFVDLALASRGLPDQGLYHWVGEAEARVHYREGQRRDRRAAAPAPDGWGRYLTAAGEIVFDLEWDRGTESMSRLQDKVHSYLAYFKNRRGAELRNVLFVVPTQIRESAVLERIAANIPTFALSCCRFWVTSRVHLQTLGPLGRIWVGGAPNRLEVGRGDAPPADHRVALVHLPTHPRQARLVGAAIGKPGWWYQRPGGGEGP